MACPTGSNGARQILEQRLASLGYELTWNMLSTDIMRAGAVDLHGDIAETVPLFVHDGNPTLTIYAAEGPSPHAIALVVRADSPISELSDLRGTSVATSAGSSSHYLLLKAVALGGLNLKDIRPALLAAQDGAAAFEGGSVAAWSVYDPFLAVTESRTRLRTLVDGAAVGMQYDRYYMANAALAAERPDIVQIVFDALQETAGWVGANPLEANRLLSALWGGIPIETVERVNRRRVYDVRAVGPRDVANLQAMSEVFLQAGVLRQAIDATSIPLWHPAAS
jgi:sulfonate transport system substrate-binding protein